MIAPRRLLAWALLAATAAAATATHRHAGLEESTGDGSESVITNHNPRAAAPHLHAVIRTVHEDPCWACHWQRQIGPPSPAPAALPILRGRPLAAPPPRSARSVARFTRLSRAPPSLL
jgi:hypothetical protein